MQIIKIEKSKVKNKRLRVYLDDNSHFDFGLDGGKTYVDGESEITKQNYWKRHLANVTEKRLITSVIPSPALFSAYLLWGESRSLQENVRKLNRLFGK